MFSESEKPPKKNQYTENQYKYFSTKKRRLKTALSYDTQKWYFHFVI